MQKKQWVKFFFGIILPTLLAIILSIGSIYFVIIPAFKDSFLDSKKEMIRELTTVAWNILVFYENEEQNGYLERHQAQRRAIEEIRHLRYGVENKDYFFITNLQPRMIMHPYSSELEGENLAAFEDPKGLKIFLEMKKIAHSTQSGYLNYTWHTKYNDKRTVPKLSYVKLFSPWQWVVGTGVFLDDVEFKTEKITNRLTAMVLATVFLFSLLLLVVTQQSFKIEKRRRDIEDKLNLSRQKYKALAESTTDPMVMIHDSKLIYANRSMYSLLLYPAGELEKLHPENLFPTDCDGSESGRNFLLASVDGKIPENKKEGLLLGQDGSLINVELSFSPMRLGDQEAIVMTAKDIRTTELQSRSIDEVRERFHRITSSLEIGTFRTSADFNLTFDEASETTLNFLGLSDKTEIKNHTLLSFIPDVNLKNEIRENIDSLQLVREKTVQIKPLQKGGTVTYSLSLIGFVNSLGNIDYYEGLLRDITVNMKEEQERENLIVELQTSLLFLNQPIKFALKDFASCYLNTSISEATKIMAKSRQSSILVTSESGEMLGIITDMVLRERVIAETLPYDTPVFKVMSSPLIYIDESALIFEAVLLMQEKNIKHLVIKNSDGETIGVISNEELLNVHRYSTSFMLSQIREAHSIEEIIDSHSRLPRIVKSLADSGAHAKNITRIITRVSDAVLEKIIELTIEEMGEPPVRFAFISLGSEGRGEQTLVTDQDNALIYEDVTENDDTEIRQYFSDFGRKICTSLDSAGYDFCLGEIMAMNSKWCQPLTVWKGYFTEWITKGSPQDLLEVNIFFDLRCVYGEQSFVDSLRQTIGKLAASRAAFLQHLAQNALTFRAPLDFFGNIHAETKERSDSFDIKKVIAGITGFARVYAIEKNLECTNTLQRIEQLYKRGIINNATYEEIVGAYDYMMKLRFKHQVTMIDNGEKPDNFIRISDLSHMDRLMLKKTFSQVNSMQKRLSYDFSGVA